jgi:hypothetical protein
MTENKNLRNKKWIDFAILYFIRPKTLNFILFILISFILRELAVLSLDENSVLRITEQIRDTYPDNFVATNCASILEALLTKGNATILIISMLLTSIIAFLKLTDINQKINNNLKVITFLLLVIATVTFSWYNLVRIGNTETISLPTFQLISTENKNTSSDIVFTRKYDNVENVYIPSGLLEQITKVGAYRRQNGTNVELNTTLALDGQGNLKIGAIESLLSVEFDFHNSKYKLNIDRLGLEPELSPISEFSYKIFDVKGQILNMIPDKIEIIDDKEFVLNKLEKIKKSIPSLKGKKWDDNAFTIDWLNAIEGDMDKIDDRLRNFDFWEYFFNNKNECMIFQSTIDANCLERIFENVEIKIKSH